LCVNVLNAEQHQVSDAFARTGTDKFAGVGWTPTPQGAPALDGAAAHIEVRIAACHDGGDHHIVACAVDSLAAQPDTDPLLYYRSGYRALDELRQLV
jgi:3-hydroxy-9,10-secoandrosta-1,3,5(10)-triene-9,17-dione monooxygenase reductase component